MDNAENVSDPVDPIEAEQDAYNQSDEPLAVLALEVPKEKQEWLKVLYTNLSKDLNNTEMSIAAPLIAHMIGHMGLDDGVPKFGHDLYLLVSEASNVVHNHTKELMKCGAIQAGGRSGGLPGVRELTVVFFVMLEMCKKFWPDVELAEDIKRFAIIARKNRLDEPVSKKTRSRFKQCLYGCFGRD
jgi:hypothetical protein